MDMNKEFSVTIEIVIHKLLKDAALTLLYEEDLGALRHKMDVLDRKRVVKHIAVKQFVYLEARRRRRAMVTINNKLVTL